MLLPCYFEHSYQSDMIAIIIEALSVQSQHITVKYASEVYSAAEESRTPHANQRVRSIDGCTS